MSHSPDDSRSRTLLVVVTALAVVSFLYSVLILGQILLWAVIVISLYVLYLCHRFVRAHERIATALESRADVRSDDEYR